MRQQLPRGAEYRAETRVLLLQAVTVEEDSWPMEAREAEEEGVQDSGCILVIAFDGIDADLSMDGWLH